eukprot:CAMPEP_0194560206 /NCGR_PEP_ID=MMETSP0292-20121207/1470_1 /TAXON_ID=39354 /ORGANISM="Heterosigma akashiwo, Strain CCMP2393" /LENGTH=132 /DNA_ID=CAMNT_0039408321 /DNA_START=90 /DNA_END=485 /DNA_ORIENTATION=+
MCISRDGKHTLVCAEGGEIKCWDNERRYTAHSFSGHRQGRFVLRPCFGGPGEALVACGGEDAQIYIWHRQGGAPLAVLSGHAGTVNTVAWSSSCAGRLFASASDDATVRVWRLGGADQPPLGGRHGTGPKAD